MHERVLRGEVIVVLEHAAIALQAEPSHSMSLPVQVADPQVQVTVFSTVLTVLLQVLRGTHVLLAELQMRLEPEQVVVPQLQACVLTAEV